MPPDHQERLNDASAAEMQDLYDNAPCGYHSVDREGRVARMNATELRWLGRTRDEVIGHSYAEFLTPASRETFDRDRVGFFGGKGELHDVEYEFLRADGSTFPVIVNVTAVRDADGTVLYSRSTVFDNTARQAAEKALRVALGEVADLYEHSPCGYHSLDVDGRYIRVNATELEWLGRGVDEVLGRPFGDFLTAESLRAFAESFPGFIETGTVRDLEFELVRPDGSTMPVLLSASAVKDENGVFRHSRSIMFDNTERHRAEAALRAMNARLDGFFTVSLELLAIGGADGRFERLNPRWTEVTGWSLEELTSREWLSFVHPDDVEATIAQASTLYAGGEASHFENRFVCADGSVRWLEWRVRMDGETVYGAARDVTERRAAEEELRRSRDELREANDALARALRAKDEFLASMSHELRTPLTGILGLAESLRAGIDGPVNPAQAESLTLLQESGQHLLMLINDVLDLAKIQAGKLELAVEPVVAQEVCTSAIALVGTQARKKRHRISLSTEPVDLRLEADPRRLKQMLVNLLSNAVKFTPDEGRISVEVTGDPAAEVVRFSVTDTGIGIEPADLAKLFQPFTQVDSRLSRAHEGTGLGLSLVSRMADLHGGRIEAESAAGVGSTFTIVLPWVVPAAAEAEAPAPDIALERAMTIEDNAIDAGTLTRALVGLGISNIVHPTGERAVEVAASLSPEVIFLDLMLPGASGWEVLEHLMRDPRTANVPVVIVSVDDAAADGVKRGAAGYLIKPVAREDLAALLAKIVVRREAGDRPILVVGEEDAPLVLLAEDNEVTARVVANYLRAAGYRVSVAVDGVEAVRLAEEATPALILMDVQMPRMDGLEAMRRLRGDPGGRFDATPIVALTALAMRGDRERCLAAGATEYLAKPVDLGELVRTVRRLVLATRREPAVATLRRD